MRRHRIKIALVGLVWLLTSCSHTKYKGFRQYYTNFTSYYNTYFNIQYKYKLGYRQSTVNTQENTADIISVFPYENDPAFFEGSGPFKETAAKVVKLNALRPYNKWMDDAYLVEGKNRYMRGQYDSAAILLQHVVDKYPKGYYLGHLPANKRKGYDELVRAAERKRQPMKQPRFRFKFAKNPATIWLIKSYIKLKKYEQAQTIIIETEGNMSFPEDFRKELALTKLMLKIAREDYKGALELMPIIYEYKMSKKERSRIEFIEAQIYEKQENTTLAAQTYKKALQGKLKSDLRFEAELKSLSYDMTSPEESIQKLRKMLRKGSNLNNQGKIYFAMGNIYLTQSKMDEALKHFKLAIEKSKNTNLNFQIFERIASTYYKKPDYLEAANYYDSAFAVIPTNYPDKKGFQRKTESLRRLLKEYKIYVENDSMVTLLALGPEKAKEKIEKLIKKEREKAKSEQAQKEAAALLAEANQPKSPGTMSGSWYFENKEDVERGKSKFQKKWGNLSRVDFWRKASAGSSANQASNSEAKQNEDDEKSGDKASMTVDEIADIEVKRLPFDKKKDFVSNAQKGLMGMARVYQYEIKDIQKAIETYELLFKKYPDNLANEDEALYSLYLLYKESGNQDLAESIKSKLIASYPNSKYAIYVNNPNAKSNEDRADLAAAKKYKEAFKAYQDGQYQSASEMITTLETEYSKHSLASKIQILKAYLFSATGQPEEFKKSLEQIITSYPGKEDAKHAQELLDLFNKGISPTNSKNTTNEVQFLSAPKSMSQDQVKESVSVEEPKKAPEPKPKKETRSIEETFINYEYDKNANHYVLYKLNATLSPNSAKTLLDVYLKTRWNALGMKAEVLSIGKERFVTVGRTSTYASALDYHNASIQDAMMKTLLDNSDIYFISSMNLDLLYISLGWKEYEKFFRAKY